MTVARQIPVRRLDPLSPPGTTDRHFAGGDLIMSHAVAVLSAMFPNGEDFFVQSVRHYRDRIDDPRLRKQVNQFVGQESMHGRVHRDLNRRLADLGFEPRLVDQGVKIIFNRLGATLLPPSVQLAVTAALEHYTATLAEVLLSDPEAQELFDDDDIRRLFLWHALEESEHKAVAFEVYRSVHGGDRLRRVTMDVITGVFVGGLLLGTAYSTALDRSARDLFRLVKSVDRLRRSPFLSRNVRRRLRDYQRPDFHPDNFDSGALLERWRRELFGPEGVLADQVRVTSSG